MNFNYGSDGWIHYDYSIVNQRATFSVALKPTSEAKDDVSFIQASDDVAKELHQTYGKIFVAMSGGIDSEYVANTFLRNQIPIQPIIFKAEDLNELDVWWAIEWCKTNNIEPVVIKQSIKQFCAGLIAQSHRFGVRWFPGVYAINQCAEYAKKNGGVLVTGSGNYTHYPDLVLSQMKKTSQDVYKYDDYRIVEDGYYTHLPFLVSHQLNPEMPLGFYEWNPQIVYSYVKEYDLNFNSAENKARIMGCDRRPKNVGYPEYFWRTEPLLQEENRKRRFITTPQTEVDYLGSREQVMNLLRGI